MQEEGKIRHIGLSEVDVPTIEAAQQYVDVVSVQNQYNLVERQHEAVLDWATAHDVAFIPWHPLNVGGLSSTSGPLAEAAQRHGVTPSQLALAWILRRSPAMLPIPGTGSVEHLEENLAAAGITLTDEEFAAIDVS
jgi:aryl-alcohol dehydrogenase-like predicted oxidoreductase